MNTFSFLNVISLWCSPLCENHGYPLLFCIHRDPLNAIGSSTAYRLLFQPFFYHSAHFLTLLKSVLLYPIAAGGVKSFFVLLS